MIEGAWNIPALVLMGLTGFITALFIYYKISDGNRIPGLAFASVIGLGLAFLGIRELALVPAVWTASAVGVYGLEGYAYLIASVALVGSLGILVIRYWRGSTW